jgi:hypothetical protein
MKLNTVVIAVVAFVVALGILAVGGRVARVAAELVTAATTSTMATTTTSTQAVASAATVTDESDDGVERVVIVGDSLVVGAQDEMIELFAANGVEHRFIAVSGTGLLTDQGVRLTELEAALEELNPDVVIIESCCNYDGTYSLADGTVVPSDSELLWDAWANQARLMVSAAQAHGAEVFFVITPRAIDGTWFSDLDDRIQRFNEIYRSLGVTLIDWDDALYPRAVAEGQASVRATDGLHLSAAGNEVVAATTWEAVAASLS